jgi:hypothetical protein
MGSLHALQRFAEGNADATWLWSAIDEKSAWLFAFANLGNEFLKFVPGLDPFAPIYNRKRDG